MGPNLETVYKPKKQVLLNTTDDFYFPNKLFDLSLKIFSTVTPRPKWFFRGGCLRLWKIGMIKCERYHSCLPVRRGHNAEHTWTWEMKEFWCSFTKALPFWKWYMFLRSAKSWHILLWAIQMVLETVHKTTLVHRSIFNKVYLIPSLYIQKCISPSDPNVNL